MLTSVTHPIKTQLSLTLLLLIGLWDFKMSKISASHLPQIDVLRAAAVLAVVLYHAVPDFLPGGFIGVDVFFVISGYVIARGYQDRIICGDITLITFFKRRIRRLFPASALLVVVCAIVGIAILEPAPLLNLGWSIFFTSVFMQNVYFWSQGDYFSGPLNKPLLHMWSLAVEEQFYFILPATFLLLRKFKFIIFVLIAILVLSYTTSFLLDVRSPKTVFYWLPFRLWQFGIGILAFNLTKWAAGRWSIAQTQSLVMALVLIGGSSFTGGYWAEFPGPGNTLVCVAVAYALFTFDVSNKPVTPVFNYAPVLFVGQISYSWYLWHWPPLSFFYLSFHRAPGPVEGLMFATFSFLLAWISYSLVENPIRKGKGSTDSLFRIWKFVTCGFIGFGLFTYYSNGLSFRYPKELQRLYLAELEGNTSRCDYIQVLLNPDREFCIISLGAPENPTLLFVGDSHVAVIQESLLILGEELNLTILMATRNCDVGRFGTFSFCSDDVLNALIEQVKDRSIDGVFAMSFWESALFSPGDMAEELDAIASLGAPVFIVETVPYSDDFNPRARLEKFNRTGVLDSSGINREEFRSRSLQVSNALKQAASLSVSRVSILKPEDYICSEVECPFMIDGEPLYFDSNHLTRTGAQLLQPMFFDALKQLSVRAN